MKKEFFLLLLGCVVLTGISAQQYSGNWDTYVIQNNHKPVSIVVDLDFGHSSEAKEKKNVMIVQVKLRQVQPDGMPIKDDIRILDKIENDLVMVLSDSLNAQYTGRYTQDGKRDFYFYSNDTSRSTILVASVLHRSSVYNWSVLVKQDEKLSNYFSVLYPTGKELEHIKNRRTVDALQAKGDQLTASRKVEHFLVFNTDANRKKFARIVQDSGFVIENAGKEEGVKDYAYSLQISRTDKVDINSMDGVSIYLWELALQYFGKYDGWETFVVR